MPRKRKRLPGRPPNEHQAIVIRLVLSLDPIKHADLIAKLLAAPARGRAAIAIDLMINGLPEDSSQPTVEAMEIDSSIDDL
jgi:hypothetical protein